MLSKPNQIRYDVAIVGAGPAGCLLAYELARAGCAVLLLEKKKLPRYKTCGGGITQRALDLIPFDLDGVIEDRAHTIRLRVGYQTAFSQTQQPPAVHLAMRDRFDYRLARHAVDSGAVLQDSTRFISLSGPPGNLVIQTSAGSFRTRVIVGADGVYSRVARALQLPLRYRIMPALEAELVMPPTIHRRLAGMIQFDFGIIPSGYAWIFPKKDHISAGILARRRPAKQLKPHLLHYLTRNGLRCEADIRSLRLHPIPCHPNRNNRYADDRGLIVGDGTGLVDPVTGEGIFYALQSAAIAAIAIKRHLYRKQPLQAPYNRMLKENIEADILKADILARILYGFPALSNWVLKRYGDKIGTKHIAVYLGEMSYRQLYRYVLSPRGVAYLLRSRGVANPPT